LLTHAVHLMAGAFKKLHVADRPVRFSVTRNGVKGPLRLFFVVVSLVYMSLVIGPNGDFL